VVQCSLLLGSHFTRILLQISRQYIIIPYYYNIIILLIDLLFHLHSNNKPHAYTQQSAWLPTKAYDIIKDSRCCWRKTQLSSLLLGKYLSQVQTYVVRHWNYISFLGINIWRLRLLIFANIYLMTKSTNFLVCFVCSYYLVFQADHKPGDILGKLAGKWTQVWGSHVFKKALYLAKYLSELSVAHCHQNC